MKNACINSNIVINLNLLNKNLVENHNAKETSANNINVQLIEFLNNCPKSHKVFQVIDSILASIQKQRTISFISCLNSIGVLLRNDYCPISCDKWDSAVKIEHGS